jgi:hypothetical protein
MTAINIKAFRGQVPRVSSRLLQPNRALRAMNCKITSGRLDPLRGLSVELESVSDLIKSMFRYRYFGGATPQDHWMHWGSDVDAVYSPIANDSLGRVYFTSEDFEPRMTTYDEAIDGAGPFPAAWYGLGVFAPTSAPSVSVSGGSTPTEARTYAYTFVTSIGEESAPSPASAVVTGNANGTWSLSGLQTAPVSAGTVTAALANTPNSGQVRVTLDTVFGLEVNDTITLASVGGLTDINGSHRIVSVDLANNRIVISKVTSQTYTSGGSWSKNAPHNTTGMNKRIYRSAGLVADLLFVAEIPAANTTYADTVAAENLGEGIRTLGHITPPKNLTCLISLPNGCLVGLSGNEVCFSEPYLPNAWPDANRYSFSGKGVALCPSGNSVIVMTDAAPILITGSDPSGMSPSVMETYAPCISKRGAVNVGGGCLYPSNDGLWLASPGSVIGITKSLYRIDEWSKVNPSTLVAAYRDGQYYGRYVDDAGIQRILVLDVAEPDGVIEVDQYADSLYRNELDGEMYVSLGGDIFKWDANYSRFYESEWVSSEIQLGRPTNFSVAQVHADFSEVFPLDTDQIAANALLMVNPDDVAGHLCGNSILETEVNGSFIVPVTDGASRKIQFTLYKNGQPVFSREVLSSKPFRIPSGYRSEIYRIGLNASVPAYSVTIAESSSELGATST